VSRLVLARQSRRRGPSHIGKNSRPTIGTVESHNRSFFARAEFWCANANRYFTERYDFVSTRGTGIAIASIAHKDFESD
jgi:hypothetical protein